MRTGSTRVSGDASAKTSGERGARFGAKAEFGLGEDLRIAAQDSREAVDVGVRPLVMSGLGRFGVWRATTVLLLLLGERVRVSRTVGLEEGIGRVVLEIKKHHHGDKRAALRASSKHPRLRRLQAGRRCCLGMRESAQLWRARGT